MEIIVLPFMTISFVIAWAVFAPFTSIDGMDSWTFAKIRTADLLAIFLPICVQLALANWLVALREISRLELSVVIGTIAVFSLTTFLCGLFVIEKMQNLSAVKRMTIIGLIVPLGTFLCFAWVVVPLLAFTSYAIYSIPLAILFVPLVFALRRLANWACSKELSLT